MANTAIQIKRSTATGKPTSLAAGELAYSYQSNTLFVGTSNGTATLNIGGYMYTSTLDAATSANTASTLVKRDANNGFYGELYGNAETATKLLTARNFSISGGDVTASAQSFDGTGAVILNASLTDITTGATVGSSTSIPVITYGANGRVLSVSSAAISTNFTIAGNTGTDTVNTGETLTFVGATGSGINTTVTDNQVRFNTDNTILRSNTSTTSPQTISGDLSISGNLIVTGVTTYVNSSIYQTTDSMFELGSNNVGDVVDIGFYGQYNGNMATGLVRDAGNKAYYLFSGVSINNISGANTIANNLFTTANTATLYASINAPTISVTNSTSATNSTTGAATITGGLGVGGNIYSGGVVGATNFIPGFTATASAAGTTTLTISSTKYQRLTGTQAQTYKLPDATTLTNGHTFIFDNDSSGTLTLVDNASGAVDTISSGGIDHIYLMDNSTAAGSWGKYAYLPGSVNWGTSAADLGGVTISNATWNGNTVGIGYGGTGATSYTTNQRLYYNGTSFASLANNTTTVTGGLSTSNTITSVTVDNFGQVTAYTGAAIAIDAAQVTTGTLGVARGGTGAGSFTQYGIMYGNATGALQVTAAAGTSDQGWSNQILTTTNAGVPVWSTVLDGGQF